MVKTVTHEEDELFGFALRHEQGGQVNTQISVQGSSRISGDFDAPRECPRRRTAGSRVPGRLREDTRHQFIIWDVVPEITVQIREKSDLLSHYILQNRPTECDCTVCEPT